MKQLTQKLKSGEMKVLEVSVPALGKGQILVRNFYSLISPGTEGITVKAARKGYIGKAKERPQQVKQVMDTLKTQGPVQTYRAVMKKLDAHSPLGYSCVGEVIEVSPDVGSIKAGDLVACGGQSACHAEVVCVLQTFV
jgi:NADPH:quinone reductase-like Zn-dependent oxidoreductase